jgi:NAD(P)-dependent dehydrogenase (short-subunit alcohol dehydrogenase family)
MAINSSPTQPGRRAFIAGASAGIGRALALRLARLGWQVIISSRRQAALEAVAAEDTSLTPYLYPRAADVTDVDAFRAVLDRAEAEIGAIDTLVLNAGDYDPMRLDAFDPALFERLMRVNFLGAVNGIAAAMPRMRERGTGQILVTASVAGYRGLPQAAAYGASKAAVLNMAEALKPEADATGVRLRVINPGFVQTQLTAKNDFTMPQIITPEKAADYIVREIDGSHFEIVFPKRFGWTLKLLRLLPYRLYFAITRRML